MIRLNIEKLLVRILGIILICLLILFHNIQASVAQECIASYDFGQGGTFYIPAKPNTLILDKPLNNQVAPWIPTSLTTTGVAKNSDGNNSNVSVLKIYVEGSWLPWDGDLTKTTNTCNLVDCDPTKEQDVVCMSGGKVIDIPQDGSNIPCVLKDGVGLYGLVAINHNGISMDPNDPALARALPNAYFRTFHLTPLKKDNDGDYFEISSTQTCSNDSTNTTTCVNDTNSQNSNYIPKGMLYFKIMDSYYSDNVGQYTVSVVSGIYSGEGIIYKTIISFQTVIQQITKSLYNNVVNNPMFQGNIRALIILYVALTGFMFSVGMLRIQQGELIIRLFKIGVVATLISPTSWNFFNTYLFSIFTDGAQSIADIVIQSSIGFYGQWGKSNLILPENVNILTAFDAIVNVLVSASLHKKIWGLLFFKWYGMFYIFFLYIIIAILFVAIIRSVMLYITAMMIVAILLVISPIFIVMLLFRLTKEFFEGWLKQLLSNAILMIIVAVLVTIIANLILDHVFNLLRYKVCWTRLWAPEILGTVIFEFYFWYPAEPSQLDTCLKPENFFFFFLVCMVFDAFVKQVPKLIDALAGAVFSPVTQFFGSAEQTWGNINNQYKPIQAITSLPDKARSYVTPGGLISHVSSKSSLESGGGGGSIVSSGRQAYGKLMTKYDEALGDSREGVSSIKSKTAEEIGDFIETNLPENPVTKVRRFFGNEEGH